MRRAVVAVPALAGALLLAPLAVPAHAEPGDSGSYGGDSGVSDSGSYGADTSVSDTSSYGGDTMSDSSAYGGDSLSTDTAADSISGGYGTDSLTSADSSDTLGTSVDSDPTGMAVGNPEMGPAHAEAVNTNADSYTGESADSISGSYGTDSLGSAESVDTLGTSVDSDPTGMAVGNPGMGPAHAEAVNTNADSYTGESALSDPTGMAVGNPEMGPAHAEAVNTGAESYYGEVSNPEVGPGHAEAVNTNADSYTGESAFSDPTGMAVNNPEMGPAHAEAVNTGAESYYGSLETRNTEMGPGHAVAVNTNAEEYTGVPTLDPPPNQDHLPQGVELYMGSSLLGPLGAEVGLYADWDRVQLSTFGGAYIGARVGAELRDPRPTGLAFETRATAQVGPGRVGGVFEVFDDGRAVVNPQASIGQWGYTAPVQISPEVAPLDPRYSGNVPLAGLGLAATMGYRHTHEYDISPITGPLRSGASYVGENLSYGWDSFVDAWNDLQEAVHGVRPDGPPRR